MLSAEGATFTYSTRVNPFRFAYSSMASPGPPDPAAEILQPWSITQTNITPSSVGAASTTRYTPMPSYSASFTVNRTPVSSHEAKLVSIISGCLFSRFSPMLA